MSWNQEQAELQQRERDREVHAHRVALVVLGVIIAVFVIGSFFVN